MVFTKQKHNGDGEEEEGGGYRKHCKHGSLKSELFGKNKLVLISLVKELRSGSTNTAQPQRLDTATQRLPVVLME